MSAFRRKGLWDLVFRKRKFLSTDTQTTVIVNTTCLRCHQRSARYISVTMSTTGRKRRRTSGAVPSTRRPIDKEMKVIALTADTAVKETVLKTTTFPCTVMGLRWTIGFHGIAAGTDKTVAWLVVVIPDGEGANTPALSDGADLYTPEQNVLAFGVLKLADTAQDQGPIVANIEGSTKTMRKLKSGDKLSFIALADTANSVEVHGAVQFFCKS